MYFNFIADFVDPNAVAYSVYKEEQVKLSKSIIPEKTILGKHKSEKRKAFVEYNDNKIRPLLKAISNADKSDVGPSMKKQKLLLKTKDIKKEIINESEPDVPPQKKLKLHQNEINKSEKYFQTDRSAVQKKKIKKVSTVPLSAKTTSGAFVVTKINNCESSFISLSAGTSTTNFIVKSLNPKKRSRTEDDPVLNFKQNAMVNSNIKRESSKELLQRKQKQFVSAHH